MSKDVVIKKEEIKCNNIINQYKNYYLDDVAKENIKEYNPNLPEILDHIAYR